MIAVCGRSRAFWLGFFFFGDKLRQCDTIYVIRDRDKARELTQRERERGGGGGGKDGRRERDNQTQA